MYTIHAATTAEEPAIADLIARYDMIAPVFGAVSRWWVARTDSGNLVATIGAELGEQAWLLRSAIVDASARGHGLGRELTYALLQTARHHGIRSVYCFSTDAGEFWQHMGFIAVPVPTLLAALPQTPQVAQFTALGWLPTEVAWCCDLSE